MAKKNIIRHPVGNPILLAIPLTMRVVRTENGIPTATDEEFFPNTDMPVTVLLESGTDVHEFTPDMDGNVATFIDYASLPVGRYSITVKCYDGEENPYRFKARCVLHVVDSAADAQVDGESTWYEGMEGVQVYPVLARNNGDNDNGPIQ